MQFDSDTIERYTAGWCWELALELGARLAPEGWLPAWTKEQAHAFVVSPDRTKVMDVHGVWPLKAFLQNWESEGIVVPSSLEEAKEELFGVGPSNSLRIRVWPQRRRRGCSFDFSLGDDT